jgi:hypothetical protein
MSLQRSVALVLALSLTAGAGSVWAQAAEAQSVGIISGRASDEAKKPYTDYTVQLRDVSTGQRASSVPLGIDGRFSFSGVTLTKKYLVELYQVKQNKIVCTAGPYALSTPALISKTDVNINCGTNSAVRWLAVAGAGTAIAVALGVRSAKQ